MTPRTWYRLCQKGLTILSTFQPNTYPLYPDSHSPDWGTNLKFGLDQSPVDKSGTSSDLWGPIGRLLEVRTQSFSTMPSIKGRVLPAWFPYFLSLESSLADEDVLRAVLKPFHIRRPESAAWIYLHVYNRRRTLLHTFARGENSWCCTSRSYW